jgi:hypothetical protein
MRFRAPLAAAVAAGLLVAAAAARPRAEVQGAQPAARVQVGATDIGGVVTGPGGPEAGVWVIAETAELPTKYAKIVVTDDAGRYLIPGLPKARYSVWVRGYGLVDSPKKTASPGATLNHRAVPAPNAQAAAEYYPAGYWLSLMQVPAASEFPGTGPEGNGIAPNVRTQAQWLRTVKSGACTACHQLGTLGTRKLPPSLGKFNTSTQAWERRVMSGQAGAGMAATIAGIGHGRAMKMFADWTDRIAQGAVPPAPPRPQGVERNVVITQWDWADPKVYLHDLARNALWKRARTRGARRRRSSGHLA